MRKGIRQPQALEGIVAHADPAGQDDEQGQQEGGRGSRLQPARRISPPPRREHAPRHTWLRLRTHLQQRDPAPAAWSPEGWAPIRQLVRTWAATRRTTVERPMMTIVIRKVRLRPMTIAESAEHQGAEGPHGEPCAERGETGKKGGCLVAGRIKQSTEEDRQAPVEKKVIPFETPFPAMPLPPQAASSMPSSGGASVGHRRISEGHVRLRTGLRAAPPLSHHVRAGRAIFAIAVPQCGTLPYSPSFLRFDAAALPIAV